MDGGGFDIANPGGFSGDAFGDQLHSSCSMDSFFDEILKDSHACTHTHTCNPPGPDLAHTHTCFHVHTKILPVAPPDESAESTEKSSSKKRPCGNREAVRKYREKKKAQTASLEEENRQLREQNQQLLKKLQSLSAMEAENMRLKCLLVDLRGRIDGEIGQFPYAKSNVTQMNVNGAGNTMNSCGMRCDQQMYCTLPGMQGRSSAADGISDGQRFGACEMGSSPCLGSLANGLKDVSDRGLGNGLPGACATTAGRVKGSVLATSGQPAPQQESQH